MKHAHSNLVKQFGALQVLVIGDAMLDVYIKGFSERICREAPVPVVAVQERQESPGGAANTAVNVAGLQATAYFAGIIGDDHEGKTLVKKLDAAGVDTTMVVTDPDARTIAKQRVVADSHLLVRYDQEPETAYSDKTTTQLLNMIERIYPKMDAVIISDYASGVITEPVREKLRELQQQYQKLLVVDARDLTLYKDMGVSLVKPNYQESLALLGMERTGNNRPLHMEQYKEALLAKTGASAVALTLDSDGALIFSKDHKTIRTTTMPRENTNAIGAGDTYISAFTLGLAADYSLREAAELAQSAADIIVQSDGTSVCTLDALASGERTNAKIVQDRDALLQLISSYRSENKRIVFTNGCFDILHSGHVSYLQEAKAQGDVLIVGVNSDESVRRLKGPQRPVNHEDDRMKVLEGLASIDHVMTFSEDTPIDLIKMIKPDVYVKGGDYTRESLPETPVVEAFDGRVKIIPFVMNKSTTSIIERIRKKNNSLNYG